MTYINIYLLTTLLWIAAAVLRDGLPSQKVSIGLLITGKTMSDELFEVYGSAANRIQRWLETGMSINGVDMNPIALVNLESSGQEIITPVQLEFEIKEYDVQNYELPEHPEHHDVYVVSGSNYGVNEELDWMIKLEHFIRELDYVATSGAHKKSTPPKLIGICFGHQLIHKALGGSVVSKAKASIGIGTHIYQIFDYHPIMITTDPFMPKHSSSKLVLDVLHNDQVVEPAQGFKVLAGNDFCPVGMTVKGNHVLTFQPHPEYPNKENRYVLSLIDHAAKYGWITQDQRSASVQTVHEHPAPESSRAMSWSAQFIADPRREIQWERHTIDIEIDAAPQSSISSFQFYIQQYVSEYWNSLKKKIVLVPEFIYKLS